MKRLLKTSILASLIIGGVTTFMYEEQTPGPPNGAPNEDTEIVETL